MSGYRTLVFSFILLLITINLQAQSKWNLALSHYRSANYDAAIQLWDSISNQEPSAAIFYNLGNAWYKNGDIPRSVLNYEKALLLDPSYKSAKSNLEVVRQEIEEPVPLIQPFFLARWWSRTTSYFSPNAWALIFLISISWMIAVWVLSLLNRINPRTRNYGMVIFFLASLLSGLAAQSSFNKMVNSDRAVAMEEVVSLYTSPDEISPVLREFPGGTVVRVTDQLDNWLLVVLPNLEQGWIEEKAAARIKK